MGKHLLSAHVLSAGASDPKSQKKRDMLLIAGGLVLVVVLYIRHRNAAAATTTPATTVDPNAAVDSGSSVTPSTFADNGAQAGALGDTVASGLSGVQSSLDAQTSAFQDFLDNQTAAAAAAPATTGTQTPAGDVGQPAATPVWDPVAASAYVAAHPSAIDPYTSQPYNAASSKPAAMAAGGPGVKINTQVGNPRAGQSYRTVQLAAGKTEHIYASGKKIVVAAPKKK